MIRILLFSGLNEHSAQSQTLARSVWSKSIIMSYKVTVHWLRFIHTGCIVVCGTQTTHTVWTNL